MHVHHLDPERQREFALQVVTKLREGGFEAYWAGGCVRDCLLDRRPKDYDVATNATPVEIRELFSRRRTLEIGAAFGVVAVIGPKPAGVVEVTTFRQDTQYSDGRRPDAVVFTSAKEDAQRRDFTINGLFYDPLEPQPERRVSDFVGGVADLERKIIRAIGDPRARFCEDKLRLLRAVRIAAGFEFDLDESTRAAIVEFAASVVTVSAERIAQELRTMLVDAHRARAVELLRETGLLAAILPEAAAAAAEPKAWRRTLLTLEGLTEPDFPLALAALFTAVDRAGEHHGKPTESICRRWRLSNKEIEHARWLVEHRTALVGAELMPWPRLQRLLIGDWIGDLLALHEAEALASGADARHVRKCRELLKLPPERLNPPPLVTGDDLIRHGIASGKLFKPLLEKLRDAQLENRIANEEEALALADRLLAEGAVGEG
ncbi:MAG TPA: CCA tRNA nucleotidyltransferase [Pirellulales bacterium]|nr:CCA tRNA nucleotidyltransferase [Pirellulales bacterium]